MARLGEPGWSYYPLGILPKALDIVWCRFPTFEQSTRPGPKPRPALVRSVDLSRDHRRARIEVTYGTSSLKIAERPEDLILVEASELTAMGLPKPTRFDLDLTVSLPWASEFFEAPHGRFSPVIGHLTATAIAQLEALKVVRRRREAR